MSSPSPEQPSDGELSGSTSQGIPLASPAPAAPASAAEDWQDLCSLEEIPEGGILTRLHRGRNLLVYRNGAQITCIPNECPHREWPFDGAHVQEGILTCPYHGYEFRLDTGQCLTAPSLPLDLYPIRIRGDRVEVRLK